MKIDRSKFSPRFEAMERVVDFFEKNKNTWYNINEIEENVNYRLRANRLSRGTIIRFLKHFRSVYSGVFLFKKTGNAFNYKLSIVKESLPEKKQLIKGKVNSDPGRSGPAKKKEKKTLKSAFKVNKENKSNDYNNDVQNERTLEKSKYPEVKSILESHYQTKYNKDYVFIINPLGNETKWGNPDLMGIVRDFESPLISVEVKTDVSQLLVGFAQCCAYKLFSDFVYYFCEPPVSEDEKSRLIKLCNFYGIGLYFFSSKSYRLNLEAKQNDQALMDMTLHNKHTETLVNKL
jgi:hypothetical protein